MSKIQVIEGEIYTDDRGIISSLNKFSFEGVKRYYVIHHPDTITLRGWHGHQYEAKWFYCLKGSFTLAFVEIDNWENPSTNLKPEIFRLSQSKSEIICLPQGYANCIKANEVDSILLVFSGKKLEDALNDSWRYDSMLWVDWSKY
ncbi:WxcM-like domain-containing protein [Dysgonomonas macrotermitis]|uniref:dTDP-4-dehydrorhamnose 3,5-epimerase n=1 Tax=Dysgonomonas macrotermitis TaxID=1346286 RepID=A0A1M5I4N3_9BACT|nr:WxcM-like domain-containing protein [Dysgonomonas macrotermitis]SHG23127.1 dTDP-4-dehydrorhamnose 3,5-epimerase [Dysgonomonas macrotermitis]